ncbi:ABC transporter [Colwellia sp. 75C3]|uniref:substrate-binding periplasmic protein n=1 Tax=Colwellia sp. 75C3 TaxID=888425 RepID=UPI000C325594|nr:ABC transporter substrate-binding protein [Colwellia sp. 75C3]PKG82059.1 ABC transporter [Colwellia sp. 75C3]
MRNILTLIILLLITKTAFADTVHLTSLSWPPYSDKNIKEQGASVAVAKAAFKAMGHELIVDFYPWSRAVKLVNTKSSKYVGYFPEYYYETNDFNFSDPMGNGPLALIQNKSKPINFNDLSDLKGLKLGVVQDYINTPELDKMIADKEVNAKAALSDSVNIKKVASKRLDMAVIDVNVFNFLLSSDKSLKKFENKVELNKNLLANKKLYIAFRGDEVGKKWQKIYNSGLKKLDVDVIMTKYLTSK